MVNSAVFDPNILNTHVSSRKENIKSLSQNKAIQKLKYGESYVNMASTIKPLTILIGLNEKLFQPEDTYLDKGLFSMIVKITLRMRLEHQQVRLHRGRLSLIHLTHL